MGDSEKPKDYAYSTAERADLVEAIWRDLCVQSSHEDPFEHRQVDLARERLGKFDLRMERLPGGHLTTNEQPEALAALIAKFERGTTIRPTNPAFVRVPR
jgi:hypothetical protein